MDKDYKQVWDNCLRFFKDNIKASEYRTWFESIEPVKLNGKVLTIQVPSHFYYEYLEEVYIDLMSKALQAELGPGAGLEYIVVMENPMPHSQPRIAKMPSNNKKDIYNNPVMPNDDHTNIKNPFIIPGIQKLQIDPKLNNRNTFNRLVEGEFNRLARSAGYAIATNPGRTSFNPLFIYGGSGLGKTHLLHAICYELLKKDPNANIVYVTGETFTNEMIEAVRSSSMPSFRMKYRDADVLLIDDIQFIGGKESTQEEFFHTFDFLYQAHRQIVLTSDRPPKEIASLADRLRSRFESGLLADIQPPDLETRMVIITRKAEQLDLYISPEVCEYIASQLKTNIRQLEGVVKKMRAAYLLTGETPSLSSAQNAIRVVRNDMQPTPITIEKILEEVARTMNVSPEDIRSQKSTAPISRARQTAVYVIREITGLSTEAIGKEFGGRDHSTIVYSYNKAKKMMETDVSYKHVIEDITKNIRSR